MKSINNDLFSQCLYREQRPKQRLLIIHDWVSWRKLVLIREDSKFTCVKKCPRNG